MEYSLKQQVEKPATYRKAKRIIREYRKTIPSNKNQIRLMDKLFDDSVKVYSSISNRGEGKTYNYYAVMMKLAQKIKTFKFFIICRHWSLRNAEMEELRRVAGEQFGLTNNKEFYIQIGENYDNVFLNGESIGIISDLGKASDLKLVSGVLKDYRMLIFDEFIALDMDYRPGEVASMQTIYDSVARVSSKPELLPTPKLMLLGNTVNFDAPLLSYFNMLDFLQHQKVNTVEQHGYIYSERLFKPDANKGVDDSLFAKNDNSMHDATFKVNDYMIVKPEQKAQATDVITVEIDANTYLKLFYDKNKTVDLNNLYLQIDATRPQKVNATFDLNAVTEQCPLIDETWFNDNYKHYYDQGLVRFTDTYSVNYFANLMPDLQKLNFYRLVAQFGAGAKPALQPTLEHEELESSAKRNLEFETRRLENIL